MYEKLVTSHPKRVDLWTSYADQLTRIGDISAARALYTRISTLGLQVLFRTIFSRVVCHFKTYTFPSVPIFTVKYL